MRLIERRHIEFIARAVRQDGIRQDDKGASASVLRHTQNAPFDGLRRELTDPAARAVRQDGISTGSQTTQVFARIYDETLYEQFKTAMSRLEAIALDDWPGVDIGEQVFAELWTAGLA